MEMFGIEMQGKTVLDIGGYDGHLAARALEHGAAKAVCLDNREWERYGWNEPMPFSGVEYQGGDFLHAGEPADVVFCMNVIYHVVDPAAGLQRLRELSREALVIRTSWVSEEETENGWKFYPRGEGHTNGTVWCRPSKSGLRHDLAEHGFSVEQEITAQHPNDEVTFVCRCARGDIP